MLWHAPAFCSPSTTVTSRSSTSNASAHSIAPDTFIGHVLRIMFKMAACAVHTDLAVSLAARNPMLLFCFMHSNAPWKRVLVGVVVGVEVGVDVDVVFAVGDVVAVGDASTMVVVCDVV